MSAEDHTWSTKEETDSGAAAQPFPSLAAGGGTEFHVTYGPPTRQCRAMVLQFLEWSHS